MRLDKYLKVTRLIKRRTVANDACDAGRVSINGKPAKAGTEVKVGDKITIGFGNKVGSGLGSLLLSVFLIIGSYDASLSAATTSMRWSIYGFSNYLPLVINLLMFFLFRGFDLEKKLPQMREEIAARKAKQAE